MVLALLPWTPIDTPALGEEPPAPSVNVPAAPRREVGRLNAALRHRAVGRGHRGEQVAVVVRVCGNAAAIIQAGEIAHMIVGVVQPLATSGACPRQ